MDINNNKQAILLNIGSTVLQVIVTGLLYYFLYKIILGTLGSSLLGVWSIVLATSSIASVGGGGFTTSLVKFLAEYYSANKDTNKLLYTSFICSLFFYVVFSIVVFFVAPFFLKYFINKDYIDLAINILPLSLIILIINSIANFFISILEGVQRNYIKNISISFSNLVFLAATYLLLKTNANLVSVITAQIIQSIVLLLLTMFFSSKYIKIDYFSYNNWSNSVFKLLGVYSLKFQIISILQVMYDPITKGLLGRFSGLQSVAYYEMSNRFIMQIRNIIVNSNQVLVPVIASAKDETNNFASYIYIKSIQIISLVALIFTVITVVSAPYISFFWIGHFNKDFVLCTTILSVSMFFNIISGPSYFGNIAEGTLKPLLYQHAFLALGNVLLALSLSFFGISFGAVWAWGLSLFVSSIAMSVYYQNRKQILFSEIMTKKDSIILFYSIALIVISCFLNFYEIRIATISFQIIWIKVILLAVLFVIVFVLKRDFLISLLMKRLK